MTGLPASVRLPRKPRGTAATGLGVTRRVDRWWVAPTVQGVLFTVLAGYLFFSGIVWTPLFGTAYEVDGYLSPLFSPLITPSWLPSWISPGLLILWIPLGFRATCYYYRKAYYRSFWFSPPACAVGEPHRSYSGESKPPLLVQNLHRYALYGALVFNVILTYDAVLAFRDETGAWGHMGLGTLVLLANAALLWLYSLSCHSCRHIVGGRLNSFSRHPLRYRFWTVVSKLNAEGASVIRFPARSTMPGSSDTV